MTKEEIRTRRIELRSEESTQRSLILDPHYKTYHKLENDLMDECEQGGHYYQLSYYNWGGLDKRKFTHESMRCKYCDKLIHVPFEEVDNIKSQNK